MKLNVRISLAGIIVLMLTIQLAEARLKNLNQPLALSGVRFRQFEMSFEGMQYQLAPDTTYLQAGVGLAYGITPNWVFSASFPYHQNVAGALRKMGQGDVIVSLLYHNRKPFQLPYHLGWRTSIHFPSGYRGEFEGFPTYTTRKVGMENLLLWEFQKNKFTLDAFGGYFSDVEWTNQRAVFGFSNRYDLLGRWLSLYSEFGHEIQMEDKQVRYQMFVGFDSNPIWGLQLRAGMEQKIVNAMDYPGLYASLSWSMRPPIPVEVRTRKLRDRVRTILDKKNIRPGFTLSPGAAESDTLKIEPQFIPLNVLVLGFEGMQLHGLNDALWQECLRQFDEDSLIHIVNHQQVKRATTELGISSYGILSSEDAQRLGELLNADFVMMGKIVGFEQTIDNGPGIPYLFQLPVTESRLKVITYLLEVNEGHLDYKGLISAQDKLRMDPLLLSKSVHQHGIPLNSVNQHRLLNQTLNRWTQSALENLFYEVEVEWVLE